MKISAKQARLWPDTATIWRWHFYAGLFCIPFVIWLSITGAIYLFKPQVETALNQHYQNIVEDNAHVCSPVEIVDAALAAVPNSNLNAYELPSDNHGAVQVLVGKGDELTRVTLNPSTLNVLKIENEDSLPMRVLFHLHGDLMFGYPGSMLVELAASWAIIMIVSGLILWWPRGIKGPAGILYPRLNRTNGPGQRVFWRDIHAVTGMWVSVFTLFLLVSGLPWAESWGGMLKGIRQLGTSIEVKQDWTTGRSDELSQRSKSNAVLSSSHDHEVASNAADYTPLNTLVPLVIKLEMAPPVLITPPNQNSVNWVAKSDAQNRTLREKYTLMPTGEIAQHVTFSQWKLIDRIVGYGVAIHEGQLFGWLNQLFGVITALGLLTVCISSIVLWLNRKKKGSLGAPKAVHKQLALSFILLLVILGILLPLLGLSIVILLLLEKFVLIRMPKACKYLGLERDSLKSEALHQD